MAKVSTNQDRINQLFDSDPRNDTAIGEALGVSKQTISAWRNGTRSPKQSMLTKIAQMYNTTEEWLLGWDTGHEPLSPDEEALLSGYRSLSSDGKKYILQTVQMAAATMPADKNVPASDLESLA